jgi:hypothetical protein
MSFLSDDQIEMYHDEKAMYLCYDVWHLTRSTSTVISSLC